MRTYRSILNRLLASALAMYVAACGSTEQPVALGEPIVVVHGSFKHGELPTASGVAADGGVSPVVTTYSLAVANLRPGARGAQLSGTASSDAYSIGVRLSDQGNGYWVEPVGSEDPLDPGQLTWSLEFDSSSAIKPGQRTLEIVAFDKDGRAGSKVQLPICVASDLPDNRNACNPKALPPLAIASLTWNADSDVDLTIVAPNGTTYGRSKRTLLSGSTVLATLDGDGSTGCLVDGRRMENFSWNDGTPAGTWKVYANLFDACGAPGVTFDLTIYQRQTNADGTFGLAEAHKVHGSFVRSQANGGAGAPLYLTDVQFQ
ncbi:MAG: hypothetical protein JWN48_296 [Myxococcaceae bacterium]|nr:hypothetical protein [Myxococcaceae bacterium]